MIYISLKKTTKNKKFLETNYPQCRAIEEFFSINKEEFRIPYLAGIVLKRKVTYILAGQI